jgi:hypothetical protein
MAAEADGKGAQGRGFDARNRAAAHGRKTQDLILILLIG